MAGGSKPRGELGELGAQLQGLCSRGKRTDKELVVAKREVFKKVINYMTLGMDMSALFPMMISAANLSADDVALKKQLYLYITHYAASTPDLGLLTINQLQKDARDQDPTVRGLALRSLCSLRIQNLLEYVVSTPGLAHSGTHTAEYTGPTPQQSSGTHIVKAAPSSGLQAAGAGGAGGLPGSPRCGSSCLLHQPSRVKKPPYQRHPQVQPVMTGLGDRHPYVRRTAVMGVLKIWHMSPDTVNHTGAAQWVDPLGADLHAAAWGRGLSRAAG